eukprot:1491168-Alexandrium_andersonii.AAC.1
MRFWTSGVGWLAPPDLSLPLSLSLPHTGLATTPSALFLRSSPSLPGKTLRDARQHERAPDEH